MEIWSSNVHTSIMYPLNASIFLSFIRNPMNTYTNLLPAEITILIKALSLLYENLCGLCY